MEDYPHTEYKLPGADIKLYPNFLADPPTVQDVIENVEFEPTNKTKVFVHGKWHNIPRRQTAYGDPGTFYRFSGHKSVAKPWTDFTTDIRLQLEAALETSFNFVLINLYNDGHHCIGAHSDDESDLDPDHMIASYTVGETRDFVLKHKKTKERTTIPLSHNSLLIMAGDTQKNYVHSIPRRKKCKKPRVNFTFRQMNI